MNKLPKRKLIKAIFAFLMMLFIFCGAVYIRFKAENIYSQAVEEYKKENYDAALEKFNLLGDFRDSATYVENSKKWSSYLKAKNYFDKGKYMDAYDLFMSLGEFEGSDEWALKSKYNYGMVLYNSHQNDAAAKIFIELEGYAESENYAAKALLSTMDSIKDTVYMEAISLYEEKKYSEALNDFLQLQDYLDSEQRVKECQEQIKRRELATSLSGGIKYSLAVEQDGTVVGTKYNGDGQTEVKEWKDIVSIDGFGVLTVGLKSDGSVVFCGKADGDKVDVTNWNDIVQVKAGERHIVGLKYDGTVFAEGHTNDGQCDVENWKGVVQIATGWRTTVGLTKNGEILITGYGSKSQLKKIDINDWKDVVAIATGGGGKDVKGKGHTAGLKSDGTVVAVGDNQYGQCDVSNWKDIVAIAAGDWHTVGLRKDGSVVTTESSSANKGQTIDVYEISGWQDIVAIAAGTGYTMGLKSDGTVLVVGYNEGGQKGEITKWKDVAIYPEWDSVRKRR